MAETTKHIQKWLDLEENCKKWLERLEGAGKDWKLQEMDKCETALNLLPFLGIFKNVGKLLKMSGNGLEMAKNGVGKGDDNDNANDNDNDDDGDLESNGMAL